jgi:hypothetical protein
MPGGRTNLSAVLTLRDPERLLLGREACAERSRMWLVAPWNLAALECRRNTMFYAPLQRSQSVLPIVNSLNHSLALILPP